MNTTLVLNRRKTAAAESVCSTTSASLLRLYKQKEAIMVQEGQIKFNIDQLELGRFYPIELEGQLFIVRKVSEDVVDIYGALESD